MGIDGGRLHLKALWLVRQVRGTPKRYQGVVRRGVVVLESGAQLPEGAEVEVIECADKSSEAAAAHKQSARS